MEAIYVTKSTMPDFSEYVDEIRDIWDSHMLTNMGPKHERFCRQLEDYLQVPRVDLFTNGHTALEITLESMQLQGEVITTPFTFASTTHSIVRNGLKPVFCDINASDFTMDVSKIEALITDQTCAIMPVHVYGNICDVEGIEAIARKHNLKVIYDAAHALGCTYQGRGIASYGDASCFSFHATKVFHTIEGGCACISDPETAKRARVIRNFGIVDAETVAYAGTNGKMNEFCAAMGICNLRHIEESISKRGALVARYRSHLEGIAGIKLSPVQEDVVSNHAYFPVVFDPEVFGADRNQVSDLFAEHQIFARKYFYPATNTLDCYKGILDPGDTPVAESISQNVLTLPLYADLEPEQVDRICKLILSLGKS